MNGALNQQINGKDKWCLTPFIPGNFDPVNGGIMGHLLNRGARACGIGVNHGLTVYLQSGC